MKQQLRYIETSVCVTHKDKVYERIENGSEIHNNIEWYDEDNNKIKNHTKLEKLYQNIATN
jgi:hypothetical protein